MAFLVSGKDDEATKLRAFPLVLREGAKAWYQTLAPEERRDWETLKTAFIEEFCHQEPPEEIWRQLLELRQTSPNDCKSFEGKFSNLWEKWCVSLGEGERAPECLKKDCFLAGLYPILREKVKVKFLDTFEKAMAYAREKDRKLKFQAQLQGGMEPPLPTQPIARAVAGTSATDQESSQQELLQQITNQLESLSINLVQGVRAPQPGNDRNRQEGQRQAREYVCYNCGEVSLLKAYKGDPPQEPVLDDPPKIEGPEEILQPKHIIRHEDKVLHNAVDSPSFCSPFSQDSAFCWNSHEDLPLSGPEYTQNVLELDIPKHRRQGISIFHQIHYSTDACLSPKIGRQRVFDTYEYTEKEKNKCFNSWDCHKRDLDVLATNPCLTVLDPRVSKWQWWLAVDDTGKQSDDFRLLGAEASHSDTRCIEEAYQQGYIEIGQFKQAFYTFQSMQEDGTFPTRHTFLALLKACTGLKDREKGQRLHSQIIEDGFEDDLYLCNSLVVMKGMELHNELIKGAFESDIFVKNTLVDMYFNCGFIDEAQHVFKTSSVQDVVSWNILISGFLEHNFHQDVLDCWEEMQEGNVLPNDNTHVCILKASGSLGFIRRGQEVHMDIIKLGLECQSILGSSLVDFYASCALLPEAQEVFDNLNNQDAVAWNGLIAGYSERGYGEKALSCLLQMGVDGVLPDRATFILSLKACSSTGSIVTGLALHTDILLRGFCSDSFVRNSLVDMYANCGLFDEAGKLALDSSFASIISLNALLAGYCKFGLYEEAIICAENVHFQKLLPNAVTYVCVLNACANFNAIEKGLLLHSAIIKENVDDAYVACALVDMYAKVGLLEEAQKVFDEFKVRDVVMWSALIAGYALWGLDEVAKSCVQHMQSESVVPNVITWNGVLSSYCEEGKSDRALLVYALMQEQGVLPNGATFLNVLSACSSKSDLKVGKVIHTYIAGLKDEANQDALAVSLIDMYGKCGDMAVAQRVFDDMLECDLTGWAALAAGYGRQGKAKSVLLLFEKMEEGLQLNGVTFSRVLSACSHAGDVEMGQLYFDFMSRKHHVCPSTEHYVCMIDLLARAGQLEEAVAIVEKMPSVPNFAIWTALLSACRKWSNVPHRREVLESVETSLLEDAANVELGLTFFIPEKG
ncbi:hypothetical protein L7F22_051336 [Adiantum nelumboides]|nr:hypothetical protein [Adiantum nelumboides]